MLTWSVLSLVPSPLAPAPADITTIPLFLHPCMPSNKPVSATFQQPCKVMCSTISSVQSHDIAECYYNNNNAMTRAGTWPYTLNDTDKGYDEGTSAPVVSPMQSQQCFVQWLSPAPHSLDDKGEGAIPCCSNCWPVLVPTADPMQIQWCYNDDLNNCDE